MWVLQGPILPAQVLLALGFGLQVSGWLFFLVTEDSAWVLRAF
jgi:hypothetical protein